MVDFFVVFLIFCRNSFLLAIWPFFFVACFLAHSWLNGHRSLLSGVVAVVVVGLVGWLVGVALQRPIQLSFPTAILAVTNHSFAHCMFLHPVVIWQSAQLSLAWLA